MDHKKIYSIRNILTGSLLLVTLTLPSVIFGVFETSSLAFGLMPILLFYSLLLPFLSPYLTYSLRRSLCLLFFMVLCLILLQGSIGYLWSELFDLERFIKSFALLVLLFTGALGLIASINIISDETINFSIKFTFYVLLISGFISTFGVNPFQFQTNKPIFFFTEPSEFALVFLPLLLYMRIVENKFLIFIIFFLVLVLNLLIENLTLLIGLILIVILFSRIWVSILLLLSLLVFGALNPGVMEYYITRISIGSENLNISLLVYLSGLSRAIFDLNSTYGLGVGFQQFGIVGSRSEYDYLLRNMGLLDLNLLDGSFIGAKLVGEFGILGCVAIFCYAIYFFKVMKIINASLNTSLDSASKREIFLLSIFTMFCVDIFIRSSGYFSSPVLLFLTSLIGINLKEYRSIDPRLIKPLKE